MLIQNARLFLRGAFHPGSMNFDTRIRSTGPASGVANALDGEGCYLIPGLVDIHSHAAVNADASDGDGDGLLRMSQYYARGGVTSWCPTTMTLPEPELTRAVETIRAFSRPSDGAKIAGIHLEGPFLSYAKRGAQNPEYLQAPDLDLFLRLCASSGELVRLVTVAPETPGAIAWIREASRVCTVSLGHTAADYDTAAAAYAAGASHTTHLYNAMPPLLHREPGVIAAALEAGATVELICDGFHIHPAIVRLTHRLFGEKLVLISDSMRCAGMPDGEYDLGGQSVTVTEGRCTITGTDTIAGSAIHLMDGLRRAVQFGLPLEAAVTAATVVPATVIGAEAEIGSLAPGKRADFVLLDDALTVRAVFVDGTQICGAPLKTSAVSPEAEQPHVPM